MMIVILVCASLATVCVVAVNLARGIAVCSQAHPRADLWAEASETDRVRAGATVRMLIGDVNGRRVRFDADGRIVEDLVRGELPPTILFRVEASDA